MPRLLPLPSVLLLLALALPAPAAGAARDAAAPRVAAVHCWPKEGCHADSRRVTPGARLRIVGRGFAPGAQVSFVGRPRDRRDDRTVRPLRVFRHAIYVRVPHGAGSGGVVVRVRGRQSNLAGPVIVRRALTATAPAGDLAGSGRTVGNTVATAAAAAAIAAGAGTAVVLSGSDAPPAPSAPSAPAAQAPPSTPLPSAPSTPDPPAAPAVLRLFAPDSVWNTRLAPEAELDPSSPALVTALLAEVQREQAAGVGPYINTTQYSTPIYRVGADQPPVYVHLESPDTHPSRRALQSAFAAVPIPAHAVPAAGSDGHMTIWQPETDRMWELWRARKEADGWHATWGGAMERVSQNAGVYGPDAWPGANSGWGAAATSLPVAAGTIKIDELRAGRIDHVVNFALPGPRKGVYAWPAQRTDGTDPSPDALPEGARLRLDPNLDLDALRMPKMTRMIAEAVQRYGMMVTDKSGTASFSAEDPTPTGSNPYWGSTGKNGFFEGKYPGELLRSFPWEHLQVLRMDLRGA